MSTRPQTNYMKQDMQHGRLMKKPGLSHSLGYDPAGRGGLLTPTAINHGGTTYFYDSNAPLPLQYAAGRGMQPSIEHTKGPPKQNMQSFFMSESIRQDILKKTSQLLATVDSDDERYKDLPRSVGQYHSLYPLDNPSRDTNTKVFGYITTVYKCVSSVDGQTYAMRKIDGFRLTNKFAITAAEVWKHVQHPNIVSLRSIFASKEFGNTNLLYFIYDYHPVAETLEMKYFYQMNGSFIPEEVLWSYICQLVSALRVIHGAGLASRTIDPSKILITGKNRLRINCLGIFDVINFEDSQNKKDISHFQQEDLLALGKLIVSLACKSLNAVKNIGESLEYIGAHYSQDLKNFIVRVLRQPATSSYPNVEQISSLLTNRLFVEKEHLLNYSDMLEAELAKEVENGRLFRLLVKLGFINERPEYDTDPNWSETGDHHLLKLFRDYVFHQIHENGTPSVDFGHVVECLNKLDVGSTENILLMGRDEGSVIVVSYQEIKRCIDSAFKQLFISPPTAPNAQSMAPNQISATYNPRPPQRQPYPYTHL